MQDMYPKLHKQGVEYVSVNEGDEASVIKKYVKEGKFTFPIVMNRNGGPDVSELYKVPGYPTNYIVNDKGIIVERFLGFDENAMVKAWKKLGFKL